ncbi:chemotaxis protein CheW [Anaeroarcus burkinensis]|uniref:chemotaxis protein CheW n=1 Tax=Anaeroarcus burkinensis TaxID=82376 RepID=UPI0003FAAF89|nr:chemotaxis protein CheW [Anaeroarcus burkinensis]
MRVMIIDDDQGSLESLRDCIETRGSECDAFQDPAKALAAYDPAVHDVVLTDFSMPQLNGLEVLENIRKRREDAVVIIITGYGNEELAAASRKGGAYAFLYKPLNAFKLYELLDAIQEKMEQGHVPQGPVRPKAPVVDREFGELDGIFFSEACELLANSADSLISNEKEGRAVEAVPEVFRAFHTIKGGSQTIGLELLAELAHKMEDLLDMIRKGEHIIDGHAISLILEAIDLMEQEIAAYVAHENMDELAQHQLDLLALVKMAKEHNQEALDFKRIKNMADGPNCFVEVESIAPPMVTEAYADGHVFLIWAKADPSECMPQVRQFMLLSKLQEHGASLYCHPDPYMLEHHCEQVDSEDMAIVYRTHLEQTELQGLVEHADGMAEVKCTPLWTQRPQEEQEAIAEAGAGDEEGLTEGMQERFATEALEHLREAAAALLEWEKQPANRTFLDEAFRVMHTFKGNAGFMGLAPFEEVGHELESVLEALRQGRTAQTAECSLLLKTVDSLREGVEKLASGEKEYLPAKGALIKMLQGLRGKESAAEANGEDAGKAERKPVLAVAEGPKNAGDHAAGSQLMQAIRVDVEKLNHLLDYVGELVIAEAMVFNNPSFRMLRSGSILKQASHMGKIIRDIQDVAMSMRMIPLTATFQKMSRLVRDVSVKSGKKVDLTIVGDETEVDKTVMEQIGDPLMHIIRNALDHGIENPEERLAAGKEETGHVLLEAKHAAGEVWIIVRDDGRGLNREKILNKARQNDIYSGSGEELKDEEIWKFIFEPGFSTAEKVTAISGRGVGMDVVKRNIERIRGRVDIKSVWGQGTIFLLRIPLTLAIIEGMIVKVGRSRYTVPIVSIRESFRPKPSQITVTPDGGEIVNVRGELLPVVRLHEFYRVRTDVKQLEKGIVVIVESEGKRCCLLVDELLGQQQIVIKGMPEYLGSVRGAAGLAVLGDGGASIILDIGSLLMAVDEAAMSVGV